MRRVPRFVGATIIVLSLVGCTQSDAALAPNRTPASKSEVYVAIGSDDSIGAGTTDPLLDAWTQLFYRRRSGDRLSSTTWPSPDRPQNKRSRIKSNRR